MLGQSVARVALAACWLVRVGGLRLEQAQVPAAEALNETGLNGAVLNDTASNRTVPGLGGLPSPQARASESASAHGGAPTASSAVRKVSAVLDDEQGNWSDDDVILIPSRGPPVPVGGNLTKRLVFVHIPLSFGHTIEKEVMMPPNASVDDYVDLMRHTLLIQSRTVNQLPEMHSMREDVLEFVGRPGAVFWGSAHPEAMDVSGKTGCLYAHTPPRHWPAERLHSYFGHAPLAFGVVRNPYERLVSIFRQRGAGYLKNASSWARWTRTCDVNGFITEMLGRYQNGTTVKDKSLEECLFQPQTAYFNGPYGIRLAVDARRFPDSVNEVLNTYGFPDAHIGTEDFVMDKLHCPNLWAGNLTQDVRELVKEAYKSDFDMLCRNFGYCDRDEPSCIAGVPGNCPPYFAEDQRLEAGKPADP